MKQLFVIAFSTLVSASLFAQGNGKGKGKGNSNGNGNGNAKVKVKRNNNDRNNNDNNVILQGYGSNNGKVSGVPAKVQAAFARDYGNISNVRWTKSRGNWTATYNGGLFGGVNSIATYHANGRRVDTRTNVPLAQIPQPVTIWQQRVGSSIQLGRILRIDLPGSQPVYQVTQGNGQIVYLNNTGTVITWNPR